MTVSLLLWFALWAWLFWALVLGSIALAQYLWERVYLSSTRVGNWAWRLHNRRRLARWIRNGYRSHMDDRH